MDTINSSFLKLVFKNYFLFFNFKKIWSNILIFFFKTISIYLLKIVPKKNNYQNSVKRVFKIVLYF